MVCFVFLCNFLVFCFVCVRVFVFCSFFFLSVFWSGTFHVMSEL